MKIFGEDHEFTKLVIDLKGKDPDDAFSSIPYEKVGDVIWCQVLHLTCTGLSLPLLPREAYW